MNSSAQTMNDKMKFLAEEIKKRTNCSEDNMCDFNKRIDVFFYEFKSRWTRAHRMEMRFITQNKIWLESSIGFTLAPTAKRGRKEISFTESSGWSKYKKTKILRDTISLPELLYASQVKLQSAGYVEESKVLRAIYEKCCKGINLKKKLKQPLPTLKISNTKALAVFVEAKLTRNQYNVVRQAAPQIFPSYNNIQTEKQKTYPESTSFKISETSVEVTLQGLLNHTAERLIELQETVIDSLGITNSNVVLYSKWGFDGSSGHSSYKQAFHGSDASDSSVFLTTIVPLRLMFEEKVIWQNPRSSSTRFCRPLKIEFTKETAYVSISEKKELKRKYRI